MLSRRVQRSHSTSPYDVLCWERSIVILTDDGRNQVQTGGSFDVDYSVVGPNEKVIMEGSKERQGDFVFTAGESGEYRFCFNNEMSTFAEKMVDFEIAVRHPRPSSQIPR